MKENENTNIKQHASQKWAAADREGAPEIHDHEHRQLIAARNDAESFLTKPPLGRGRPDQHERKKLAAEKIFDASVYGVWNYGIMAGTSVAGAMWFQEGGGKPYFEKAAKWMGDNVMSKITSKTGEAAARESHTWLIFASLITVGNLFIPPMRYVEKDKEWYVSKINDWLNDRRYAKGEVIKWDGEKMKLL